MQKEEIAKIVEDMTSKVVGSVMGQTIVKLNKLETETEAKLLALQELKPETITHEYKVNDVSVKLSEKPVPWLDRLIYQAMAKEPSLLIGPSGCGKSHSGEQLAKVLGLPYLCLILPEGADESWLLGMHTPSGYQPSEFVKMLKSGGVIQFGEIDAANPNMLLIVNNLLANGYLSNPISGETTRMHDKCVIIADSNTMGKGADNVYVGRNRLDGATLDRFTPISVGYDEKFEQKCCPDKMAYKLLNDIRAMVKTNHYDEIVSSRAYIKMHRLMKQGVKIEDIIISLCLSWSDDAQSETLKLLAKATAPKAETKKVRDEEIPF